MRVATSPVASVTTTQEGAPLQTDSCAAGLLVKTTVAPATGAESGPTTLTRKGFVASVPAGVGLFPPCKSWSRSFGPAPAVSTSANTEEPRVAGLVSVTFNSPSANAGTAAMIWVEVVDNTVAGFDPMVTAIPGRKPIPLMT